MDGPLQRSAAVGFRNTTLPEAATKAKYRIVYVAVILHQPCCQTIADTITAVDQGLQPSLTVTHDNLTSYPN